jgi:hypothetical protein
MKSTVKFTFCGLMLHDKDYLPNKLEITLKPRIGSIINSALTSTFLSQPSLKFHDYYMFQEQISMGY